jgi:hypothetical protein
MHESLARNTIEVVENRADGASVVRNQHGQYFKMSPASVAIASKIAAGETDETIIASLTSFGHCISQADFAKVRAKFDVVLRSPRSQLDRAFLFRYPVISKQRVQFLAGVFQFMYSRLMAVCVLTATTCLTTWAIATAAPITVDAKTVGIGYSLFILSVVFHEFGHAAASKRCGAEPSEIGLTVYACFPAFYTDVTNAWALTRRGRILVDCGGIYFQSTVGAVFAALYLVFHQSALLLALNMIIASCLFTLDPFVKSDGYWMLSDFINSSNLAASSLRWLRNATARVRSQELRPSSTTRGTKAVGYTVFLVSWLVSWGWVATALARCAWTGLSTGQSCMAMGAAACATLSFSHLAARTSLDVFNICFTLLLLGIYLSRLYSLTARGSKKPDSPVTEVLT